MRCDMEKVIYRTYGGAAGWTATFDTLEQAIDYYFKTIKVDEVAPFFAAYTSHSDFIVMDAALTRSKHTPETTVTDVLIEAVAKALEENPALNAHYEEESITRSATALTSRSRSRSFAMPSTIRSLP